MHRIIALVGPTAGGKSAIAVELAQLLNAEIVSCDSMQVYRHMPVLTQAPTAGQRSQVPHHLIDCMEPTELFSVGRYRRMADAAMEQILARDKRVLLVGGTGLYLRAIGQGLCEAPAADPRIREELWNEVKDTSSAALHHRLQGVDLVAAARIHPNDARRIVRALEVYALTGKPLSAWWQQTSCGCAQPMTIVGIQRDRIALNARIRRRLLEMVYEQAVIHEARLLLRLPLSSTVRQVHGLADLERYLTGTATLKETLAIWEQRVRQYARRQLIWFRRTPGLQWVNVPENENPWETASRIIELIRMLPTMPVVGGAEPSDALR